MFNLMKNTQYCNQISVKLMFTNKPPDGFFCCSSYDDDFYCSEFVFFADFIEHFNVLI